MSKPDYASPVEGQCAYLKAGNTPPCHGGVEQLKIMERLPVVAIGARTDS